MTPEQQETISTILQTQVLVKAILDAISQVLDRQQDAIEALQARVNKLEALANQVDFQ